MESDFQDKGGMSSHAPPKPRVNVENTNATDHYSEQTRFVELDSHKLSIRNPFKGYYLLTYLLVATKTINTYEM